MAAFAFVIIGNSKTKADCFDQGNGTVVTNNQQRNLFTRLRCGLHGNSEHS